MYEHPEIGDYYRNYAIMQHYGIPTRLLDVTKDKYTALYMACNQVFNSYGKINNVGELFYFKNFQEITEDRANKIISEGCRGTYFVESKTVLDNHINDRQRAQQGAFILFGNKHDELYTDSVYIINKKRILEELDDLGYNEKNLIPELEHKCHYIVEKAKNNRTRRASTQSKLR